MIEFSELLTIFAQYWEVILLFFFSLQKLKKMAEPRLLKLQSPAYGEPIFYKWPLINTVKYLLKFHNFILLILSILAGAKEKDYHSIGLKGV